MARGRRWSPPALLVLAACYPPKRDPLPQLRPPASFLGQGGQGDETPPRWWKSFGDQHAQLALVQEQLRVDAALLELMTLRFQHGLSPSFEALQQQHVSAAGAQIAQAEGQIEILGQQRAVLLRPPRE